LCICYSVNLTFEEANEIYFVDNVILDSCSHVR
jgi:hypothetical protein